MYTVWYTEAQKRVWPAGEAGHEVGWWGAEKGTPLV